MFIRRVKNRNCSISVQVEVKESGTCDIDGFVYRLYGHGGSDILDKISVNSVFLKLFIDNDITPLNTVVF